MKISALLISILFSAAAFAQTTLNDKQIAKALITINEGEIEAANVAEKKAQNKDVKDYAKFMIDEHKKNIKETRNVAKKEKMSPVKSELSESLEKDATQARKSLKDTDKAAFDKAYVDNQVAMHEKALSSLNETFIPQAQNAALKAHLEKTRDAVSAHLAHAKQLQTQYK